VICLFIYFLHSIVLDSKRAKNYLYCVYFCPNYPLPPQAKCITAFCQLLGFYFVVLHWVNLLMLAACSVTVFLKDYTLPEKVAV